MPEELPSRHRGRALAAPRYLGTEEKKFLAAILRHGEGGNEKLAQLESCVVQDMNDGGMGSLYFPSDSGGERKLGRAIVEAEFLDRDGILVSAVVNLDDRDELFELDIWKADFSALLGLPEPENIRLKPHR